MKIHYIKCNISSMERIHSTDKTHTIRLNDRDYQTGDKIVFERVPDETGNYQGIIYEYMYTISHIESFPTGMK